MLCFSSMRPRCRSVPSLSRRFFKTQAESLIDDPRVKGVALTGSERSGEAIASRAGKNLKKSTMELGGSDAFVVLDDADLDHIVAMAILGRFGNNGQTCIGANRFIIGSLLDTFLSRFMDAAKACGSSSHRDSETIDRDITSVKLRGIPFRVAVQPSAQPSN
jgi:acyl-CoA reductase-like NAD-dependent aldehyde dehydrogenase